MQVTKFITFDMAHRLPNHEARCRFPHGHTWKVGLTISSENLASGSSEGMVFDFKDIKKWLMEVVDDRFDHSMTLYYKDPLLKYMLDYFKLTEVVKEDLRCLEELEGIELTCISYNQLSNPSYEARLNIVNFIPTSENLASYFKYEFEQRLFTFLKDKGKYTNSVKIQSVELWETANSRCIV